MMMLRAILFSVAVLLAAGTARGQASATCGNVYVDAQLVLSGAGWLNVQGNAAAWAALPGALVSDLASLLGRAPEQIAIGSVAAGSNSLTVVFTARSNALAEAARIAALIRDDVPASAPLPATLGVYSSVGGQSSADVSVATHTATSRDVFDSTCADSSNGNEITTAAPVTTSSSPNEVTTAAPATPPANPCGWVYIDAQIVLNGAGWLNVQGNAAAWAALPGALVSDLAALLGRSADQVSIESLAAGNNALTVVFTVRSNAIAEATRIAVLVRDVMSASSPLPATKGVYSSVGGQSSADVIVASHTATSRGVFDSTCADSSNGNEITTAAPVTTSSSPNEVTTAAPATPPANPCGWVYIDAQIVLSGAGWLNVQGNAAAWAALPGALVSDLAALLGRSADQVSIESLAAGNNALTVVFTVRSNAIAEATRIAVLVRDVMSASSPLPATKGVYSSVGGQSSADVIVASHTATSRGVFDSTCADSSNGNEITTAAPVTTSSPNEVTTAAPATDAPATTDAPVPPPTPTGQQFVYIDAQFVLSGAGWLNVQANAAAWAALPGAFASDAASLVGRGVADITVNSIAAAANALTVVFTVRSDSLAQAARIAALLRDDIQPASPLPATLGVYALVGQSAQDVSIASHTATSRDVLANAEASANAQANGNAAFESAALPHVWALCAMVGFATTTAFIVV